MKIEIRSRNSGTVEANGCCVHSTLAERNEAKIRSFGYLLPSTSTTAAVGVAEEDAALCQVLTAGRLRAVATADQAQWQWRLQLGHAVAVPLLNGRRLGTVADWHSSCFPFCFVALSLSLSLFFFFFFFSENHELYRFIFLIFS